MVKVKVGQTKSTICPLCGKKIIAVAAADGMFRMVCGRCGIVACSKQKNQQRMEIQITFVETI